MQILDNVYSSAKFNVMEVTIMIKAVIFDLDGVIVSADD